MTCFLRGGGHLIRYHGAEIDRVMALAADRPELLQPLSPALATLAVDVLYAVQEEMAMHLEDVFFRRTGAGTIGQPDETALEQAAAIMAAELGWTAQQKEEEKNTVLAYYVYEGINKGSSKE